jgi:deazaflavin-dependent oxidoreductase (nitroreductase family)
MTALQGEYAPSARPIVRNQVASYEASGGRRNVLPDTGQPIVVLATRGRKTGNVRKVALMRVEHGGEYALVASQAGAPDHPDWYHNIVAHPDEVTIQDGPAPFAVRVREVIAGEREVWWERAVAAYPLYADYQQSTDRRIPIFVATPSGG